MPIKKIPIAESIVAAIDEVGLTTHGARIQDGYIDEIGNIVPRPGMSELCDFGEGASVHGLHWWEAQDWVVGATNGKTFKITDSVGTEAEINHSHTDFVVGSRVVYADYKTSVYGANGNKIKEIKNDSTVIDMQDADAPTTVTHVAFLDRYLLANQVGSRNFHQSAVGAPNTWNAVSYDIEGQLDDVLALGVANLEITALCERTMEIWRNDGSTPMIRELQGFIERGTTSANSLTWCGEYGWIWIDQFHNVVRLDGRMPTVLSPTLTKHIQSFTTVSDAIGDYIVVDGRPWYVLTFPSQEETLAYDLRLNRWYPWGYWNASKAEYEPWRGNCACFAPGWNFTLIGDRGNSKVYKLDGSFYDDDGDDLRTMVRTASINWDAESTLKRSKSLTFRLKKYQDDPSADTANIIVKWRDNGDTTWKNEHTVSLGAVGNTEFRGQIRRCGKYYARQYEILLNYDHPLALVSVEEDFEYLGA